MNTIHYMPADTMHPVPQQVGGVPYPVPAEHCFTAASISMNGATLGMTTLGAISPVAGALLHNMITVAAVANASKKARIPNERVSWTTITKSSS